MDDRGRVRRVADLVDATRIQQMNAMG